MNQEEHHVATKPKNGTTGFKIAITALAIIALCGVSFMAGMSFQKKQNNASLTTQGQNGSLSMNSQGFGGRMGMRAGSLGTVTAISATSISIQNIRTNTTSTYAIDSATTVSNNGATAAVSDIKVGDTVIIEKSTTDTSKVSRIIINPAAPTTAPESGGSTTGDTDVY